jgi:hypothetical protein
MAISQKHDDDRFWQKLILPEEDRRRLCPDMPWKSGYRWFRSHNVVPIEQWRRRKAQQPTAPKTISG